MLCACPFTVDIDECYLDPTVCGVDLQCLNTVGSYRCHDPAAGGATVDDDDDDSEYEYELQCGTGFRYDLESGGCRGGK